MMKQNKIKLTKKKFYSIAVVSTIILIILMIFLGAYCLRNFFYNLVDKIDLEKINEINKKLLVETFKKEMKAAIHLCLFMGIILGWLGGALVSKMLMIIKKEELNDKI